MRRRMSRIFGFVVLFLTCCQNHGQICVQDQLHDINGDILNVCAEHYVEDRSVLVRFTLNNDLNSTFNQFRFVLRLRDNAISHGQYLKNITNFERFDQENSVRLKNLDAGIYEICVEFRQNRSNFIYEPRDGCVTIQIGHVNDRAFDESSVPILIILGISILIFFVLGLTIPPLKKRRDQRRNTLPGTPPHRTREFVRSLFKQHFEDQGQSTSLRHWMRVRIFRHLHSLDHEDFNRISHQFVPDQKILPKNTRQSNRVFTIAMEKSRQKRKKTMKNIKWKKFTNICF